MKFNDIISIVLLEEIIDDKKDYTIKCFQERNYNKFIIDYPLKSLKDIGCTDVTVILGGTNYHQIVNYIKDGEDFGFNINYIFQKEALGIAQGINLCKNFLKNEERFTVILRR